jgi:hypothetical protein
VITILCLVAACWTPDAVPAHNVVAAPTPTRAPDAAAPVPFLDAMAWFEELRTYRPELAAQHVGRIDDPGWQALVIRPQYREAMLLSATETYADLIAREYDDAARDSDLAWAQRLRDAQRALIPTATLAAAGYPIDVYVGYRVGPQRRLIDEHGYGYKVFFTLDDFQAALAPESFLGLAVALERAGVIGDAKVDLRPGQVRFQYNNVIVHVASRAMAACAQAVGEAYFADRLSHVGRGVDVYWGRRGLDWHHFLLTGRADRLPAEILAFVRHRDPLPDTPCPR